MESTRCRTARTGDRVGRAASQQSMTPKHLTWTSLRRNRSGWTYVPSEETWQSRDREVRNGPPSKPSELILTWIEGGAPASEVSVEPSQSFEPTAAKQCRRQIVCSPPRSSPLTNCSRRRRIWRQQLGRKLSWNIPTLDYRKWRVTTVLRLRSRLDGVG